MEMWMKSPVLFRHYLLIALGAPRNRGLQGYSSGERYYHGCMQWEWPVSEETMRVSLIGSSIHGGGLYVFTSFWSTIGGEIFPHCILIVTHLWRFLVSASPKQSSAAMQNERGPNWACMEKSKNCPLWRRKLAHRWAGSSRQSDR